MARYYAKFLQPDQNNGYSGIISLMNQEKQTANEEGNRTEESSVSGQVAGGLMVKLFGPLAKEIGEDLVGWYRAKRKANLDAILTKAAQKAETAGAERALPSMSATIPMIEKASLEDDASMQDKWASLLAASVSLATAGKMRKSFPQILSELEPLEAKMLDTLYAELKRNAAPSPSGYYFSIAKIIRSFGIDRQIMDISLRNFLRLGLCQHPISGLGVGDDGDEAPEAHLIVSVETHFSLTELGVAFVECCRA